MNTEKHITSMEAVPSRRDFMRGSILAGIATLGMGTFLQSCAEKKVALTSDLARHYVEGILKIIKNIRDRELPTIKKAAAFMVNTRFLGHDIYAAMSGGMFPAEIDAARPGSPHIFILDNIQSAAKGDVVLTNDPARVRGFSERMVKIIGITTPSIPNNDTPPGVLTNMGIYRIEDVSDIVINCHVPYTDGILSVEGIDIPICPASSIIHSVIYHALAAEILDGLAKNGIYPKIG